MSETVKKMEKLLDEASRKVKKEKEEYLLGYSQAVHDMSVKKKMSSASKKKNGE